MPGLEAALAEGPSFGGCFVLGAPVLATFREGYLKMPGPVPVARIRVPHRRRAPLAPAFVPRRPDPAFAAIATVGDGSDLSRNKECSRGDARNGLWFWRADGPARNPHVGAARARDAADHPVARRALRHLRQDGHLQTRTTP